MEMKEIMSIGRKKRLEKSFLDEDCHYCIGDCKLRIMGFLK
jgi:hypothetical protein